MKSLMKSKESLAKEIKDIFKKELGIKISLNDKIYNHKQWDSIGNFNILLKCEKHFNIKFNSNEFIAFESVFDVVLK